MFALFRNEWRSRVRSAFSGKDVALTVILALLALYFLVNALALGFFLDRLILENDPNADVWHVMNRGIFFYFLFELVVRLFMQNFPLLSIQPYLLLPVSRSKIFHFLLLRSLPNFFNLIPLVIALPFAWRVVFGGYGTAVGLAWLAFGVLAILFNHYLAFYLKRVFSIRPVITAVFLLLVIGVYTLDRQGIFPASEYYASFIELASRQPVWLLVPALLVAGIYFWLFSRFRRFAYLDAFIRKGERKVIGSEQYSFLDRFGVIGDLIRLDINLIRRNKRPRTMVLLGVFMIFYPLIFDDILMESMSFMIFIGIFVTGFVMLNYGQLMLSWESSFFNFLMSQQISMRDYYRAKFYLFGASTVALFLVSTFYGLMDIRLPLVFFVSMLFNIGVNSFIVMFFSTYNVKKVDLEKGAFFNYEGVNASQFAMILPVLLVPILLYLPFGMLKLPYVGLGLIGLLGVLGIVFREQLLDMLYRKFISRKHILTSSFHKA